MCVCVCVCVCMCVYVCVCVYVCMCRGGGSYFVLVRLRKFLDEGHACLASYLMHPHKYLANNEIF